MKYIYSSLFVIQNYKKQTLMNWFIRVCRLVKSNGQN